MPIEKSKLSTPSRAVQKYRPSEHNLADRLDYVQAIGMISIETVDLELRLADLFARMVGVPLRVGRAIFLSPKSEQARLDVFRNAAQAEFHTTPNAKQSQILTKQKQDALKKIIKLLHRSGDAIQKRHRIIHDDWNISDKDKEVTRRRIDGGPSTDKTPVPIKELTELIKTIRILIDDVYAISVEFKAHHPSMVDLALDGPEITAVKNDSTNSG